MEEYLIRVLTYRKSVVELELRHSSNQMEKEFLAGQCKGLDFSISEIYKIIEEGKRYE